jgi:tetratricopeptide (TPR) repeat protein
MKSKIIISAILLFFSFTCLKAQNEELDKANSLYKQTDYQGASQLYEDIAIRYGVSPELYYNIGNAYYKAGEVGRSILNYERALRLSPNYEDAKVNLELAQTKVVDNIVQVPPFFVKRWIDLLIKLLNVDQWYIVSLVVFVITLLCFLYFIFGNQLIIRRFAFYGAFILLVITIISGTFGLIRKSELSNHNEAIIMTGTVVVKSSPDKSGTDLFQLHEGTKVSIKSKLDEWTEIVVGNGNIGWLETIAIEKI